MPNDISAGKLHPGHLLGHNSDMSKPGAAVSPDHPIARATDAFAAHFDRPPQVAACAPGRINLIGEHTDYNDGHVLPMAIEQSTLVLAAPNDQSQSRFWAMDIAAQAQCDLRGSMRPLDGEARFANYVLGVVKQFRRAGNTVPNVDLAITSGIPMGAGLGSSAALTVAASLTLEHIIGLHVDASTRAQMCVQGEHEFAGTMCGLMDMLTSIRAERGHALLLDCRSEQTQTVRMPPAETMSILIADTGVKRDLASGEYAERRTDCYAAARALEVLSLRDATLDMLERANLKKSRLDLAKHVIEENARTLLAASALRDNDLERFGKLLYLSHDSLRSLFRVSCPELDTLVEAARELGSDRGVFGARMTGAGFGGSVIVCCKTAHSEQIRQHLSRRFQQAHGSPPTIWSTRPAGGAHVIPLESNNAARAKE